VTSPSRPTDGDAAAAVVLRLVDLATEVERIENDAARRVGELARDGAATMEQVTALGDAVRALAGRADQVEQRLADITALLDRLAGQVGAPGVPPDDPHADGPAYQVNPAPPWWKPGDQRYQDAAERLTDWVTDVYRPLFGYLVGLLAPCWQRHPLCLAYLDVLHEAWCLLYLAPRDPKMVFAQLDWLTRYLPQAAEVMAHETRACRDRGRHRDPGHDTASLTASPRPSARRQ
jgi:hypothetical protein